ncbi:MAG: chromosome partitioning protein [Nitrospirales bacterium]|nr:MAG: chromosome partitioning protein [Nitrospirales bacterium]
MDQNIQILVVGEDKGLQGEFEAALQGVSHRHCITSYASDYRRAEEMALNRQPNLICVDMEKDFDDLKRFTHEIHQMLPETTVAAMYRPDQFSGERSESAVVIDGVRAKIQDFLRHPLSSTELRQLLDRLYTPRIATPASSGKLVSFVSNKGGVGKSTLAVNAACLLATRHPGRVLLIDASLQLGVCSVMLDLLPTTSLVDAVREKDRLDETLLRQLTISHTCGLQVLAAPSDALEGSEIDDEAIYRILNFARRAFDYVIIDTFPILDSTVLSVLDLSDLVYIVMQGTAPNVIATSKFLPILEGLGVGREKQRLLLNQNYRSFTGNLSPADIEERLTRQFDGVFPYQKGILAAANAGVPYSLGGSTRFGFSRSLMQLTAEIELLGTSATRFRLKTHTESTWQQLGEFLGRWRRG